MSTTRRQFLGNTLGSGVALGAGLGFLSRLHPVSAADAEVHPVLLRPDNGIEPTIRLLEETRQARLLEEVAARLKNGLSYRELLAALLLAGVRNVQPRPQVGFKFHAVLVINSAHMASIASPDTDRWLPIFWALDRFKSAQLETQKANGWKMAAVDSAKLPSPSKARAAFISAMDAWDEPAADAAAAALAHCVGRNEAFELFARYGARDFRDIGHKAIFVANSFRCLEAIGWQHAEPVLRSLAYALLQFDGQQNPGKSDLAPDRPWRHNIELAKKVRPEWQDGAPSAEASARLLATFRTASSDEACAAVVEALNANLSPASVWDTILAAGGELLMRKTGITTLHSVTSANALRYAYETSADTQTRLMLLLQNAAFLPLYRSAAGQLSNAHIDELAPAVPGAAGKVTVDDIFTEASHDRPTAAAKAFAYLENNGDPDQLMHAARRLVFLKGTDAHDYKFSAAVIEDYYHASPAWRNRCLASSLFYLPGSGAKDNALVQRTRAAFGA